MSESKSKGINLKNKRNNDDEYYTPQYAIEMIKKILPKTGKCWECFTMGNNELIESPEYIKRMGYDVITSSNDFFKWKPDEFDFIISNPPYDTPKGEENIKARVIKRCLEFNKPFALLIPTYALQTKYFKALADKHKFQLLMPSKKIQFYKICKCKKDECNCKGRFMTGKKYNPKAGCSFYTCWITYGFNYKDDFVMC